MEIIPDEETSDEAVEDGGSEQQGTEKKSAPTFEDRIAAIDAEEASLRERLAASSVSREELKRSAAKDKIESKFQETFVNSIKGLDLSNEATRGQTLYASMGGLIRDEISRQVAESRDHIVDRIGATEDQRINSEIGQTEVKKKWLNMVRTALLSEDLDPETTIGLFNARVNEIKLKNPGWFDLVEPKEQYIRIARDVKGTVTRGSEKGRQSSETGMIRGGAGSFGAGRADGGDEDNVMSISDSMKATRVGLVDRSKKALRVA